MNSRRRISVDRLTVLQMDLVGSLGIFRGALMLMLTRFLPIDVKSVPPLKKVLTREEAIAALKERSLLRSILGTCDLYRSPKTLMNPPLMTTFMESII